MKAFTLTAALAIAPVALAETETHSVNYSYSLETNGDLLPRLRLPGFNDLGGQRVLTGVNVSVQSEVGAKIAVENMTAAPLSGWTIEAQHLVLSAFERETPKSFGPFAFLGGLFLEPAGQTLAPSDNTAGGGDDYFPLSDSTKIDSNLDLDPADFSFFAGGGEVIATVGPFNEFLLDGITPFDETLGTGDATINFVGLDQSGTFNVTYQYTVVPVLGLMGGACLLFRRRR